MIRSIPSRHLVSSLLAGLLAAACSDEPTIETDESLRELGAPTDQTSEQGISEPTRRSDRQAASADVLEAPRTQRTACGPLPDPWKGGPIPDPWNDDSRSEQCDGPPVDQPASSNDPSGTKR